jgi:hypothetical protein
MSINPDTSPLLCQGCQEIFPTDPQMGDGGRTSLGGVCPLCEGPLMLVGQGVQATVMRLPNGDWMRIADLAQAAQQFPPR